MHRASDSDRLIVEVGSVYEKLYISLYVFLGLSLMLESASEVAFMADVLSKPTQFCQIVKVFCVSLWAISNNQSLYHTKTFGSGQPSEQ